MIGTDDRYDHDVEFLQGEYRRIDFDTLRVIDVQRGMFRTTAAFKLYMREFYGICELQVRMWATVDDSCLLVMAVYCN